MDEALGQLASGAFFFRMRSCEFLTVRGKHKTKRLKIRNICFFKNNIEITDKTNPLTSYAETVSITFEFQKKKKNITVTQPQSGKKLCPVVVWANIIHRGLSYKGTTLKITMNNMVVGKK